MKYVKRKDTFSCATAAVKLAADSMRVMNDFIMGRTGTPLIPLKGEATHGGLAARKSPFKGDLEGPILLFSYYF